MTNNLSDMTNYKKIFSNTYWGSFDYNCNSSISNDLIIKNRNKFIEDYEIKRVVSNIPNYILNIKERQDSKLDHLECYITKNKEYILVISPYNERDLELIEKGWIDIYKLYSTGATTYIKILPMKNK